MKKVVVIDGQSGRMGQLFIERAKALPCEIVAVGTNAIATANMLKADPDEAATGENAIVVCSRKADVICGPVGVVIADAMNGEVTPKAARAVGQADARRVLIPLNRCDTTVVGVRASMGELAEEAAAAVFART